MKGKLVDYITNPNGSNTPVGRHVNPKDKGKLYKSPDVFSILDCEDDTGSKSKVFLYCFQFPYF